MAHAAPPIVTGIWSGQAVFAGEEGEAVPLLWNLTLAEDDSGTVPRAFGASLAADGHTVRILCGTWSSEKMTISVEELSTEAGAGASLLSFRGRLDARAGALSITGDFTRPDAGAGDGGAQQGSFGLVREAEQGATRAAIFVGKARPDASLADFDIPTNPVSMSLALLGGEHAKSEEGRVTAFGAGYLNDAADVPDKPMLFYSVVGTHDPATMEVRLTKRYQLESETEGYEVTYDLKIVEEEDEDTVYLEGKWDNPKGGSFGKLSCRRLNPNKVRIGGLVIPSNG